MANYDVMEEKMNKDSKEYKRVRESIVDTLQEDLINKNSTHENSPPGHDCGVECGVSMEDQIRAANPFYSPLRSGGKKHKKCMDCWNKYIAELADQILSIEGIEIRADDQSLPVPRTQVEFIEKLKSNFKRVI